MKRKERKMTMNLGRRNFIGLGIVSAVGVCAGCAAPAACGAKKARGRSWYNGVEVGCITYSYRSMRRKNAEDIVRYAVEDGLGTLELKGEVVDEYLKRGGARDMKRLPALRKMFDDAGISIHIVKYGGIGGKNAKEDEYRMAVAKALGAKCITREVPKPKDYETIGRRCAALADRHGVFIAFHNHTQIDALTYDGPLLGYSPNLRINFDNGHYVAASTDDARRFIDPLAFVEKYHDRIFSIHLKDRTTKAHGSKNLAFGKGDTPLAKLMPFLQNRGSDWPKYCDIELEYVIPKGSDAVKEVACCNAFCRRAAGC
jgi:sugar phosphate isomerase/epimerase